MNILVSDYNGADGILQDRSLQEWNELETVLQALPVYLKASDQAGRQGRPIFDPVATNAFIRDRLRGNHGWETNILIPPAYSFLGTDIDAGKSGVMVEVQFSNYPSLLNNTLRAELFFQGHFQIGSRQTEVAVIVTKGRMFPASNSTLYYEQAQNQLNALARHQVFRVPLRLVGLVIPAAENLPATWTDYGARYSRDMSNQHEVRCDIQEKAGGRCRIAIRG